MAEIVRLRDQPLCSDIPGQLRQMADMIECGEIEATSAMLLIPVPGDYPKAFGWGDHLGDLGNIGLLELAKAWFVANKVAR